MPRREQNVEEEQQAFNDVVLRIEEWWQTPKQKDIKRPYSAVQVASLRPTFETKYASSQQAIKLWQQFKRHLDNGTTDLTFGCTEPLVASQIVKYCQSVYVSGGLCSLSRVDHPGIDTADYPWDTVPKAVEQIYKSQEWHDQRQHQYRMTRSIEEREELENWDYMAPIVADGDMGFGNATSTMKMAKRFVEAGVAMIHIDDLAIAKKRFTVGQGRTVAPLSEYVDRLTAVRLQLDIMGAETMLMCRTDNDISEFISDTTDYRDHEYIMGATVRCKSLASTLVEAARNGIKDLRTTRADWIKQAQLCTFDEAVKKIAAPTEYTDYVRELERQRDNKLNINDRRNIAKSKVSTEVYFDWDVARSRDGQYFYKPTLKAVLERCLAVAHLGEVTWARMDAPKWPMLNEFYGMARKAMPGRMFAFGYVGAYDWQAAMTPEEIRTFPWDLARYGVVWQVQPIWAAAGINLAAENFAKLWSERGIEGYYEEVQKPILAASPRTDGVQKPAYSGAFLADAFFETINSSDLL